MQVFLDADEWRQWRHKDSTQEKRSLLTIGNFDGVHLGHRQLLEEITKEAEKTPNAVSVLLSFFPHPIQVLRPEKKHTRLFDLQDQQEQLSQCGLGAILRQAFSREFSNQSAYDFLYRYILKYFHPRLIVVGHDFSFGAHRQGTIQLLQQFCLEENIELKIISPLKNSDQIPISTSAIRSSLSLGNLALAEEMLGRKYYLQGVVEKGEQRGKLLGFPTANIRPDVDFYPKMGVYACRVSAAFLGSEKRNAVMNIGFNRTFVEGDHHPIKAEVHVLDYQGDLYGRTLKVEFHKYLRPEKKFNSLDELKQQIALDIIQAREILA